MNWKRVLSFVVSAGCAAVGHYYGVGSLCVAGAAAAGLTMTSPFDKGVMTAVKGVLEAHDGISETKQKEAIEDLRKAAKKPRNGIK